jgi:hypothetical protein
VAAERLAAPDQLLTGRGAEPASVAAMRSSGPNNASADRLHSRVHSQAGAGSTGLPRVRRATLSLLVGALACGAMRAQETSIGRDAQLAIVTHIGALLEQQYVSPDVGKHCAAQLRTMAEKGAFAAFAAPEPFAARLTEVLRELGNDQHLLVRVRALPAAAPAVADQPVPPLHEHMRRLVRDRERNFGFERVERLEGNVGYLDLRYFAAPWLAQPTAVAAMAVLANADALIFDLRHNQGGMPGMVQFLCSYLFVERTHLNSLYFRDGDRTDEFWTHDVPGRRMPDVPVFLLTSSATFSAAEEFCYNLRTRNRATLVGEQTRGGANPGRLLSIDERFEMVVPTGRAINPVTGTNWDGVGVTPHVAVVAEKALAKALELAQAAAATHRVALQALLVRVESAHLEALRLDDGKQSESAATALTAGLQEAQRAGLLDEGQVNLLGYELLGQGRHALAVAAFACNVAAFPGSGNAHDSLGEARKAVGDIAGAIASYERALGLDPNGPNSAAARAVLAELRRATTGSGDGK